MHVNVIIIVSYGKVKHTRGWHLDVRVCLLGCILCTICRDDLVSAASAALADSKSVEGLQTGQVYTVDG